MKICDRHYRDGESVVATDEVTFQSTDEKSDLCHSCAEDVRDFIHGTNRDSVVVGKAKEDNAGSV